MPDHFDPQLESIRAELRRIRDGVEVIAMAIICIVGLLVVFSGYFLPAPSGWKAYLAGGAIFGLAGWVAHNIRTVR